MKKKNLALFLALTMVAASFVGCGDKKASDNGSAKQEAETETEGSEEGRYLMWSFRGRKNIYIPFKKRCEMVRRKSGDSKRLRIFLEKNL